MPLTRQNKKELFEKIKGIMTKSKSVVFLNFKRLKVADINKVRRQLKAEKMAFTVSRKSILEKALADSGIKGTTPPLAGEIAFAYGDDLIAPAREIHSFSKDLKESLTIVGGIFDGEYKNQAEMMAIATIPPVKSLHAMIAFSVKSPLQKLAIAMHAIATKKGATN